MLFEKRLWANFDWVMFLTVAAIACMGLVNLYSSSYTGQLGGSTVFQKQLYFFLFSFALILIVVQFDYRHLLDWNKPIYLLMLLLLIATFFTGSTIAGTQRWIPLGFLRLQPSEPAKLMLVIILAGYYYRHDTGKGLTLRDLVRPGLLTLPPFILILKQPDLGTSLMLVIIFISMTLFVKLKWATFAVLTSGCLAMLPLGWNFMKPYQKERVMTFVNSIFDPAKSDVMDSGYQIMQSKITVGSGLFFGKGYLKGTQGHLHFLPERHTDFAFSVLAEEWGFAGCLFFLACYFLMILWGLHIGLTARDRFGVLLAFGIVALIFWQAVINLLMVMGFLPVVGIPLPLFSYGGSSLLTTMLGIAILINIRTRRFMATGMTNNAPRVYDK